jgi:UTP--glucose-1-phosphate uridylyltransferase
MKIKKAVITAAAPSQRSLPLQTLVDRDGATKSALRIILEEAASAGIDEACLVICPGDQQAYADAAGPRAGMIQFVEQKTPGGYGQALFSARAFVGTEPFLHLVSDHLYVSSSGQRCAQQLVKVAEAENCSVSAVQATRENMLPYYGTVGGRRGARRDLYEVETVAEKPTPTEAEQRLIVPGLRAGFYLCFFGMHVLTPAAMDLLGELVAAAKPGERVQLSAALARLAARERYLALEVQGRRHDLGVKYGLLMAQVALALDGADRDEILSQLVEQLALRHKSVA